MTAATNARQHCCTAAFVFCVWCSFLGCQKSEELASEVRHLETQVAEASKDLSAKKEQLWAVEARIAGLDAEEFSTEVSSTAESTDIDRQELASGELARAWNERKESLEALALNNGVSSLQQESTRIPMETRKFLDGALDGYKHSVPGSESRIHEAELRQRTRLTDNGTIENQSVLSAIFSREFLLIWLVCFPALLLVWAIIRQDFRHRIRAYRRALVNELWLGFTSYAKAVPRLLLVSSWFCIAILALMVAIVSLRSHRPSDDELLGAHKGRLEKKHASIRSETDKLAQRVQNLETEASSKEQANNQKFVTYIHNLTTELIGSPNGTNAAAVDNSLTQMRGPTQGDGPRRSGTAEAALTSLRGFGRAVGIANRAEPEFAEHSRLIIHGDKTLADFEAAARSRTQNVVIGRALAVGFFFLVNVGLVVSWRRRRSRLDRAISNVCPRCLAEKTLQVVPSAQGGSLVKCNDQNCNYTMELGYRHALRLRLPLVGLTEAGKTVWLTMFHRSVEQGRADTKLAKFDRVTSPTGDDVYDKVLERLVEREKTERTPYEATRLREPLLFDFSDGDAFFAPSNGILNVFDLAGAISSPFLRGSDAQDRAYRATDGFFYFVDPTRVDEKYLTMQREQLLTFCEELRKKRDVPYGTPLHVPIAVCISKLDMLAKPGEAGTGAYQQFIDKLNPATRDLEPSLKELRRRHSVFVSYRDQLLPGWDIEEQFMKLVGGRYMFFPMSAAGFTGVTGHDPKEWNFKPFGVVEPLVWLLHMNGFKTL